MYEEFRVSFFFFFSLLCYLILRFRGLFEFMGWGHGSCFGGKSMLDICGFGISHCLD